MIPLKITRLCRFPLLSTDMDISGEEYKEQKEYKWLKTIIDAWICHEKYEITNLHTLSPHSIQAKEEA